MSQGPESDASFSSPGYVKNGVVNIYEIVALKSNHHVGVDDALLKYAAEFHIDKLRMLFTRVEDTPVGQRLVVEYGYIPATDFPSLRDKREKVPSNGRYSRVARLLKKSDFEMHHN